MVFETVPNRRLCLLRSAGMEDVNLVEEFIPRIGKAACGGSRRSMAFKIADDGLAAGHAYAAWVHPKYPRMVSSGFWYQWG